VSFPSSRSDSATLCMAHASHDACAMMRMETHSDMQNQHIGTNRLSLLRSVTVFQPSQCAHLERGRLPKCRRLFTRARQSTSEGWASPGACGRAISTMPPAEAAAAPGRRPMRPKSLSGARGPSCAPSRVHWLCSAPCTTPLPAVGAMRALPIQLSANARLCSERPPPPFSRSTLCTCMHALETIGNATHHGDQTPFT
jgi:hypothetical protein